MKKLIRASEIYLSRCSWKDIAILKFCVCSVGVLIGIFVPSKHRKKFFIGALLLFAVTYIPLMTKFLSAFRPSGGDME